MQYESHLARDLGKMCAMFGNAPLKMKQRGITRIGKAINLSFQLISEIFN
jgi:hypothetical protein